MELSPKFVKIINCMDRKGGYVTPHEISADTGIAYVTVQKYLKDLKKWGVVIEVAKTKKADKTKYKKRSPIKRYSLNYDKILGKKE